MGKGKIVLCDTNILVHYLRGNELTKRNLEKIAQQNIAFSIITHAEILYGTKKKDFEGIKKLLSEFKTYHITEETSKIFNGLILNYAISHRMEVPDGLIAAIAIANNVPLYTENVKHFNFIPEIKLYKGN